MFLHADRVLYTKKECFYTRTECFYTRAECFTLRESVLHRDRVLYSSKTLSTPDDEGLVMKGG